jgi:hypothetical protein
MSKSRTARTPDHDAVSGGRLKRTSDGARGPDRPAGPGMDVSALLDAPLAQSLSCERVVRIWSAITGRTLPKPADALEEFHRDLQQEVDLPENHVELVVRQLCAPARKAPCRPLDVPHMLASYRASLGGLLHPWFAPWYAFVAYALGWCGAHGYSNLTFLARDALPFYYLACGMGKSKQLPSSEILNVKRCSDPFDPSSRVTRDPAGALRPGNVGYVDTGCYGTIVRSLMNELPPDPSPETAVFFFYSRNPHIFGFMNYLAFAQYGLLEADRPRGRNPVDLAAMAFDTLETIPKPYRLIERDRSLAVEPVGIVSFALSVWLYADLYRYARQRARGLTPHRPWSPHLRHLATRYLKQFAKEAEEGLFWVPPTPKWQEGERWLQAWDVGTLPPQHEIFGILAG